MVILISTSSSPCCWMLAPSSWASGRVPVSISCLGLCEDAGLQDFRPSCVLVPGQINCSFIIIDMLRNDSYILVPLCLAPVVARQVVPPLHVSSSFIFPPTFPSSRRFMDGVGQLYMLRWSSNPSLPPALLVGIKSLLRYAISSIDPGLWVFSSCWR
jgi:hypothetical protein